MIKSGIYASDLMLIIAHNVVPKVFEYANESKPIVLLVEKGGKRREYVTRFSESASSEEIAYVCVCVCVCTVQVKAHTPANPFIWLTSLQLFYLSKFPTTDLCDLFVSYPRKKT